MIHPRPSLPEIDLDFEPIYSLTPEQYDRLVNALFNLLVELMTRLEDESNPVESRRIAEQAPDIFADYDDDLADILTQYIITSSQIDDAPAPAPTDEDIFSD